MGNRKKDKGMMDIAGPLLFGGLLLYCGCLSSGNDVAWVAFGLGAFFLLGAVFNIAEMGKREQKTTTIIHKKEKKTAAEMKREEEKATKCQDYIDDWLKRLRGLESLSLDEKIQLRIDLARMPKDDLLKFVGRFTSEDHSLLRSLVEEVESEMEKRNIKWR